MYDEIGKVFVAIISLNKRLKLRSMSCRLGREAKSQWERAGEVIAGDIELRKTSEVKE